jgi:hypothetical protein
MCYVVMANFDLKIPVWDQQAKIPARLVISGVELSLLSSGQRIVTRRCLGQPVEHHALYYWLVLGIVIVDVKPRLLSFEQKIITGSCLGQPVVHHVLYYWLVLVFETAGVKLSYSASSNRPSQDVV